MRAELTPVLLGTLDLVLRDWEQFAADERFMGAGLAFVLLGYYREPLAYPFALQFLRFDEATIAQLTDKMIGGGFSAVLASTFDGDLEGLIDWCTTPDTPESSRVSILHGLATLHAVGRIDRNELNSRLRALIARVPLERSRFWDEFVTIVCDFRLEEHRERAVAMCHARIVDPDQHDPGSIESDFSDALDSDVDAGLGFGDLPKYRLITDVVAETAEWDAFQEADF